MAALNKSAYRRLGVIITHSDFQGESIFGVTHPTMIKFAASAAILLGLAAASEPTCKCQPLGPPGAPSFLVTRLWNIVDAGWTDQDVIDEFDAGFAPTVTALPGFQRYTAATTGDDRTVFFMNAFDSKDRAAAAQEAAKEFVSAGRLNGAIEPNHFTQEAVIVGFSSEDCPKESMEGMHLSTRAYFYHDPASVNLTALVQSYTDFQEQVMSNIEGWKAYVGSTSAPEGKDDFAYNIFSSEEAAKESNELAAVENDETKDFGFPPADLIAKTEGVIAFDYLCAAGNAPTSPPSSPSSTKSAAARIEIVGAIVATMGAYWFS